MLDKNCGTVGGKIDVVVVLTIVPVREVEKVERQGGSFFMVGDA